MMRLFLCLFIGTLFSTAARSQFDLGLELRPRMEFRNGYRFPSDTSSKDAFFISQRTRLNLDYADTIITAKLSIQDVRVWGDQPVFSDDAGLSIAAAWVQWHFARDWYLRTGRQELSFGDKRLIGPAEWRQQARSHDALLLLYQKKAWLFQLAGAFNQNAERLSSTSYGISQYKALGVFQAKRYSGPLKGFFLVIADGTQNLYAGTDEMDWRFTSGGSWSYPIGLFTFQAGGYSQNGVRFVDGRSLFAYMLNGSVGYRHNNWSFTLGYDILSGNDSIGSPDYRAFDNLYATRNAFYGRMDYYYSFPGDMKEAGLHDAWLLVDYKVSYRHQLHGGLHYFQLDKPAFDPDSFEYAGKDLGQELDLWYSFQARHDIQLELGQCFYLPGEDLPLVKGGSPDLLNTWSYFTIRFTPTLFTTRTPTEELIQETVE